MRVFIIDNGSKYIDSLATIFLSYETRIVRYDQIDNYIINDEDMIILSGGHGNPVLWHPKEYAQEIRLVESHKGPVIGICLGFQLIVHVFGSHFHLLSERRKGLYNIETTMEADGILDLRQYTVYENHNWSASKVIQPLISLAVSEDGVEIIKHDTRQIYAMQFHPEEDGVHDGKYILSSIINAAILNN